MCFFSVSMCSLMIQWGSVYSVLSDSLQPHRLQPTRLLCPWDFPGKNTRVGCHFLLQEIFLTLGLNLRLLSRLRWQVFSLPLVKVYRKTVVFLYVYLFLLSCKIHLYVPKILGVDFWNFIHRQSCLVQARTNLFLIPIFVFFPPYLPYCTSYHFQHYNENCES